MRRLLPIAILVALAGVAAWSFHPAGGDAKPGAAGGSGGTSRSGHSPARRVLFGHSVRGRALTALRLGDPSAKRKVLVVGVIHGDEKAGAAVVRRLRRTFGPTKAVDLWTVLAINPDGLARGARRNAHGVDLNRNFSYRWSGSEPVASGYYAGPKPFSEPESRALRGLIERIRPDVTISYHQPWGQVLAPCRGDDRLERRYSELSGVPLKRCRGEGLPGTVSSWQEHRYPGSTAFVVELPVGDPSRAEVRRNARAAAAIARTGPIGADRPDTSSAAAAERAPEATEDDDVSARAQGLAAIKPPIHDMLIPFPPHRKREMAAYSKRHYGKYEWRLKHVKTIVEHLSVTSSVQAVYNTFASDQPDVEFGELPNVCSHFVIGQTGLIYRLVPLTIRCRHTVGLNYVAAGIEHVGSTETDVLGNPRELHASLRLTKWLRCRYRLAVNAVIGHNESLSSPWYRELDPRFRGQTHGDWRPPYMDRYRRMLRALGPCPAAG